MNRKHVFTMAAGLVSAALATTAGAAVVRVSETDFNPTAGLITFSEFPLNTINPTYNPTDYGGGAGDPVVTFDGYFVGQMLSPNPGVDCPGAAATACVVGTPSDPLTLEIASPATFIDTDAANPTSPVLSGTPQFNGPIAVLFDSDQFGVGFDAGFFDAAGSTAITAFDRSGGLLGSVVNTGTGIEFLGLVTDNGVASIAGVFLELVGSEPAGFAIDNLRFGQREDIDVEVPAPATLALMAVGLLGAGFVRRRSAN
jgi:hypothetical protein